jgi:hypothetical protein
MWTEVALLQAHPGVEESGAAWSEWCSLVRVVQEVVLVGPSGAGGGAGWSEPGSY